MPGPALPYWGSVIDCKRDDCGNTRDRALPLFFFSPLVKTEVVTEADEDVKTVIDSHTHTVGVRVVLLSAGS